jgi:hypothetical protein
MRSAGKVTNVDTAKAVEALYRDLSSPSGRIRSATAKKLGFSIDSDRTEFGRITASRGGFSAARFSDRASVSADIKGTTPRVLAMADALGASPADVAGPLLARVIEETETA